MSTSQRRRSLAQAHRAIEAAIAGGKHQLRIDPDGAVTILPIEASAPQADDAALDAEIRGHLGHGDVAH
jgi:hypothetical protein